MKFPCTRTKTLPTQSHKDLKRDPGQEDETDATTVQVRPDRTVRFREDTKNVSHQDFDPGKYGGRDELGSSADEVFKRMERAEALVGSRGATL